MRVLLFRGGGARRHRRAYKTTTNSDQIVTYASWHGGFINTLKCARVSCIIIYHFHRRLLPFIAVRRSSSARTIMSRRMCGIDIYSK